MKDISGMKFGRLTAAYVCGVDKIGDIIWRCKCECGNEKDVASRSLKSGSTKSCGCIGRDYPNRFVHGEYKSRLWRVWNGMKDRCYREKHVSYSRYGGRGIKMCDEWKHSFVAFRDWAVANGYDYDAERGKCTIDRIDGNGDYCPQNCRFVDSVVQSHNRLDYISRHGHDTRI